MKYSKYVNNKSTPQTQELLGKTQVKNNAGGFVFSVSDKSFIERFLTIGTEGGTYYVSEQKLTVESARNIVTLIQTDGDMVFDTLISMVTMNRLFRLDAAIFTLALILTYGKQELKNKAYYYIPTVCKNSTHLFTFCEFVNSLRGWSRGLRSGVSKFYTLMDENKLASQLVQFRQRNGWTHKDVMRLSHPSTDSVTRNQLFAYAVGKESTAADSFPIIKGYEQAMKSSNPQEIASLINKFGLRWEMIPTDHLNNKVVQWELIKQMPYHALLRNLNRFTSSGLLSERSSEITKTVINQLISDMDIKRSNVHPVSILNTLQTYSRGYGFRGNQSWTPNGAVVDALSDAFNKSFKYVQSTNKRILVAVDVSGSMQAQISNMALSAREAAAALATTFLNSEPNVELIYFNSKYIVPSIGKRSSYKEVFDSTRIGGNTDVGQPYRYALDKKLMFDAIITLTDNETWAGKAHVVELSEAYKKTINHKVKEIVVAMAPNTWTQFPSSTDVLNISGFDGSIPELINTYITGE